MFDIAVPGLSENRPSILRGDDIHVCDLRGGKACGARLRALHELGFHHCCNA